MLVKIETAKVLVTTLTTLKNRWTRTAQLREIAIAEDMENRQKLVDPTLSPEDFTKFSNLARAAQRRRANLHDKLIEIEEAFRENAMKLQTVGTELFAEQFVMPKPELAQVDEAYLEAPAEEVVEGADVFVDIDAEPTAELETEEAA